jgi:hypothetical protein
MISTNSRNTSTNAAQAPTHPIASALPIWQALVARDAEQASARLAEARREGHVADQVLHLFECGVATLAGQPESALPTLRSAYPQLFTSPAVIDDDTDNGEALCTIRGLLATGDREQAETLAAAGRRHAEEQVTGEANRSIYLARLTMALGEEDEAIALLERGVDQGWLGSFDWALSLREDWLWADVADRPEVVAIAERIDAGLAAQRAAVVAQLEDRGVGVRF